MRADHDGGIPTVSGLLYARRRPMARERVVQLALMRVLGWGILLCVVALLAFGAPSAWQAGAWGMVGVGIDVLAARMRRRHRWRERYGYEPLPVRPLEWVALGLMWAGAIVTGIAVVLGG